MKSFIKEQRGITLIALVITVIVLLILAGVAIAMLSGENGILKKAAEAKTKTTVAGQREEESLKQVERTMNRYIKGNPPLKSSDVAIQLIIYKIDSDGNREIFNRFTQNCQDYTVGKEVELKIPTGLFNNYGNQGLSLYEFPTTKYNEGQYEIYAIAQEIEDGITEGSVIDTSNFPKVRFQNYESAPFYLVSFNNETSFGLMYTDKMLDTIALRKKIGDKNYALINQGYYPNEFNMLTSNVPTYKMEVKEESNKLSVNGNIIEGDNISIPIKLYRNCMLRFLSDLNISSFAFQDKRLDARETSVSRVCTIYDSNAENLLKKTDQYEVLGSGKCLSGFKLKIEWNQVEGKKINIDNCGIYFGDDYSVNYADRYITITDNKIILDIPEINDDITICMFSDQKFE